MGGGLPKTSSSPSPSPASIIAGGDGLCDAADSGDMTEALTPASTGDETNGGVDDDDDEADDEARRRRVGMSIALEPAADVEDDDDDDDEARALSAPSHAYCV